MVANGKGSFQKSEREKADDILGSARRAGADFYIPGFRHAALCFFVAAGLGVLTVLSMILGISTMGMGAFYDRRTDPDGFRSAVKIEILVSVAALAVAAAFPAAGATRTTGGTLNMIAWEGYLQPQWVKPFEQQSGCKVVPKYAGSSDEMVTLMRSGGGNQYDLVSASGDASLRLIYGKDVQTVDPSKIPDFKNFGQAFQSPPNNTIGGKHYGISLQWGPNTLLYNTKKVKPAPGVRGRRAGVRVKINA